jgi:site-specific DNA-methyltransferase (adenine-specific)
VVQIRRGDVTATLMLGDCFELAAGLPPFNCVISDPPFSERTHKGHDAAASGNEAEGNDRAARRELGYTAWSAEEARAFCTAFNPDGWCVVITDHMLGSDFEREMRAAGRYTFAPLPSFTPGRSVRMTGDGPCSWTDWIVVSRTKAQIKWGTLPGGYINGRLERGQRMGGKPLGLMQALVRDYSRTGDTVLDPCMGAGTTGLACIMAGRNFIGIERDEATFQMAVERIQREANQGTLL